MERSERKAEMLDIALLCPVTPFEQTDGHRMAMASDLQAILDNKLTVGVATFLYEIGRAHV